MNLERYPTRYEREEPCPKCGSKIFYKKYDRCVNCSQKTCREYQKGVVKRNKLPKIILLMAKKVVDTNGTQDTVNELRIALAFYEEMNPTKL